MYRAPLLKALADGSLSDAVFLQPTDDIREKPFALQHVLGYLGMTDPTRWAVPDDDKLLLGIVKVARCLGVHEVIEHLASVSEIPPSQLKQMKTGQVWNKIRTQTRCVCHTLYLGN